ncbi:ABC transporter substrate-binding protein, partial [Mycobacterium tuberculosis]|nr:ABC transporter substrate-binding protein [Mycobacterium tuberculosis]
MVLGHGGNAVTVSLDVWRRMQIAGAPVGVAAGPAGKALARALASLGRRPRFGVVHTNSSHNYELRYWLAASGILPERDVE